MSRNWWVAIVGAGPAGLFAANALAKRGAQVDVFERQFAPLGLVRYGVAPDHEKIKRTQVVFEKILAQPNVRLFGAVEVGSDVSIDELLEHYDQVLIAMGSSGAKSLGIAGETKKGSISATELVNWYNGHPDFQHQAPDLSAKRAVVFGMGNVAVDVARILLRSPAELASTDIASPALKALEKSSIREVVLLARRGPNQAAFEDREVRELAALGGVSLSVEGYVSKRKTSKSEFIASFPRGRGDSNGRHAVLHFCASPVEILGKERVEGVRIERNDLVESAARMRAVGTGDISEIKAGLVVRAIGYQGTRLPGVPFSDVTHTIPHLEGRVLSEWEGEVAPNLYVAGWIKRGPTGLIGTNKACAVETVKAMEVDLNQVGPQRDEEEMARILRKRGVRSISSEDWAKLDLYEREAGARLGRSRKKILSRDQAFSILDGLDVVSARGSLS